MNELWREEVNNKTVQEIYEAYLWADIVHEFNDGKCSSISRE